MKAKRHTVWAPLENITEQCSDDFLDGLQRRENAQLMAVWRSALYEVYEFRVPVPGWPGDEVTWLSIKRRDKDVIRDWRHLQKIKNDICGPEREAVELFPSESRLVDTSNQFHLWVLASGVMFPFGYTARAVVASATDRYVPNQARQRPFGEGEAPEDAVSAEAADVCARVALAQLEESGVTLEQLLLALGNDPLAARGQCVEFAAGARVEKIRSAPGDRHPDGAGATVIEPVPVASSGRRPIGYVVRWDGDESSCFVLGTKLRSA